jgi:RNA polymerase sigma factor (sigma-70 family)
LLRLLCAITAAKARQKARFHDRQKRASGREHGLPAGPDGGDQVAAREPTPSEAVAFADQLQHLLAELEDDERRVVELRLQEYKYTEIAKTTGMGYRTVKRTAQQVREKWQGLLEASQW